VIFETQTTLHKDRPEEQNVRRPCSDPERPKSTGTEGSKRRRTRGLKPSGAIVRSLINWRWAWVGHEDRSCALRTLDGGGFLMGSIRLGVVQYLAKILLRAYAGGGDKRASISPTRLGCNLFLKRRKRETGQGRNYWGTTAVIGNGEARPTRHSSTPH